jgi:nicotinate-nucleotide--dimethylbenzimidazole phosphoribosyltransferase
MSDWLRECVATLDKEAAEAARGRQSRLTKPQGSLGRLEELAIRMASFQGRALPEVALPHILIFAGDHGIVEEGVSAFPAEVTTQMIHNFIAGGAAISVLAKELSATLSVIDVGSHARDLPNSIITDKIAYGSANMRYASALRMDELEHALGAGRRAVERACGAGADILIFGEMGIGNTSAAAAVAAALSGIDVSV